MHTVTFIDHTGIRYQAKASAERSLMQIARDHAVPGIIGECGGCCSCATCHAYVDEPWASRLPARSETEEYMLEEVPDLRGNSRLCCQIQMTPDLDGVVVHVPEEQP